MRRRAFLAAAGCVGPTGCLSSVDDVPSEPTTSPTKGRNTPTPVRRTADGIAATFQVLDGHRPTEDTASATFDDERVTVTGTVDPSGCNRPALKSVQFDAADDVVHLAVGVASPYGRTATIECGNASFDYRSVLSADSGRPTAVEVVHDYRGKDDRSFVLERG